jgi:hypothetical protein
VSSPFAFVVFVFTPSSSLLISLLSAICSIGGHICACNCLSSNSKMLTAPSLALLQSTPEERLSAFGPARDA